MSYRIIWLIRIQQMISCNFDPNIDMTLLMVHLYVMVTTMASFDQSHLKTPNVFVDTMPPVIKLTHHMEQIRSTILMATLETG